MKIRNGFVSNSSTSSFMVLYFEIKGSKKDVIELAKNNPDMVLYHNSYDDEYWVGQELPSGGDDAPYNSNIVEYFKEVDKARTNIETWAQMLGVNQSDVKVYGTAGMETEIYQLDEYYIKELEEDADYEGN